MIYQWKCKRCDAHMDIKRSLDDSAVPPKKAERTCKCPAKKGQFVKVYASATPFETLRDQGHLERLPKF